GVVEELGDLVTEGEDERADEDHDRGEDQAVLDGGDAPIPFGAHSLELAVHAEHGVAYPLAQGPADREQSLMRPGRTATRTVPSRPRRQKSRSSHVCRTRPGGASSPMSAGTTGAAPN